MLAAVLRDVRARRSTSSSTCAPGVDESAQRADALAIAEMKPFAVLSALKTTGDVLAQRKIITFDVPTDPEVIELQAPYRWSWSTDYYSMSLQAAEVLGKQLWGGKAKWAGDESMQSKTRVFGIIYPGCGDASPYPDIAVFEGTVKKYGGGTDRHQDRVHGRDRARHRDDRRR